MIESRSAHTSLRVHLIDASEHLRLAARSLERAANLLTGRSARRVQGVADRISAWATRLDPRRIEAAQRRGR